MNNFFSGKLSCTEIAGAVSNGDSIAKFSPQRGCSADFGEAGVFNISTGEVVSHELSISLSGDGRGTVKTINPIGAIVCPGSCESEFSHNELIQLAATPALKSIFVDWRGCDSEIGLFCDVELTSDTRVTATFRKVREVELDPDLDPDVDPAELQPIVDYILGGPSQEPVPGLPPVGLPF